MNTEKYFNPPEAGFSFGCDLDLRARIAQTLIVAVMQTEALSKLGLEEELGSLTPRGVASHCCDIADQLVDQFGVRGWIRAGIDSLQLAQVNGNHHRHFEAVKAGVVPTIEISGEAA